MIRLEDLEVYKVAMEIGKIVWGLWKNGIITKKTLWANNSQKLPIRLP